MRKGFSASLQAAVCCLVLTTCPVTVQAQSFGDQQAKLVVLEPVRFQFENKQVEAVGTAEAIRSVILYPAVADEVMEINFVPGQHVEAGKVLLKLDDRKQQVALRRAKLQLEDAERTYKRLQESRAKGAIPQSELDDAQTARDLAKVAVDEALNELQDRHLSAPFSGVVGISDVEVGDRITLQTPVTTLDDRSKLYVNFKAPESALNVLLNAPNVTLEPWTQRNTQVSAEIAQLDSRINEADRTLRARAVLDNSKDAFRPGMSFRVNLAVNGDKFAAIPEAALSWSATGAYIWKAVEGKAKRIDVNVHQRLRGTILVSGELEEGDQLIAEGIQRLRNGQAITTELAPGVTNG